MISEKDFLFLIDPVLRNAALTPHKLKTIVLDPGHGGRDNGASGLKQKEKNIVLKICQKLKKILVSKGYKVIMTRNQDVFIPLKKRPVICSKYDGDIFISVHCNASRKKKTTGIETFLFPPARTPSTDGSKPYFSKYPGNKYDYNNLRLAYEIQKWLAQTKRIDRGVKHAKFAVLRHCDRPAVLVETGFISSPYSEKLLSTNSYQELLAKLIANGIISYHKAIANGKG